RPRAPPAAPRPRLGPPPPAPRGHVSAQALGHLGPPGGLLVHDSQACYPCRPRTPRPALMRTSAGALRRAARLRPWLRDRRRPLRLRPRPAADAGGPLPDPRAAG